MAKKIDIDIISVTPGSHGTYTVVFSYTGDPGDIDQIGEGERLTIEIPSHAPPPAPK